MMSARSQLALGQYAWWGMEVGFAVRWLTMMSDGLEPWAGLSGQQSGKCLDSGVRWQVRWR